MPRRSPIRSLRALTTPVALCALLVLPTLAAAQVDGRYAMTIEDARVVLGASTSVPITFDNFGDPVQGWSFGVCHDESALALETIELGLASRALNDGGAPDFVDTSTHIGGWTTGVIVCLTGCASLPPSTDNELYRVTYREVGGQVGRTDLCFCDRLGSPAVESMVVVAGESIRPITTCGRVELVDEPPFIYSFARAEGSYSPLDGRGNATVELTAVQRDLAGGLLEVAAFSMALAHDPAELTVRTIEVTGAAAALNGGSGPEFVGPNLLADGVTIGTVFSFTGADSLFLGSETALVRVEYVTVASTWLGNEAGGTSAVALRNDLGVPPVENLLVIDGRSYEAELATSAVSLTAVLSTPFRRGDCNNDTSSNIADAIWLLNYLFLGGASGTCLGACDTDGDASLGLVDAVLLLQHWMAGGPPPAAPYPDCGTDDAADCEGYPSCVE